MSTFEAAAFLFIYGSLKRGGSNHARMAGQRYLGPARTAGGWALYSLGEYPGIVPCDDPEARVRGELWAVDADALARLDEFEGVGEELYARRPVRLAEWPEGVSDGEAARAEAYVYTRSVEGRTRLGEVWPVAGGV